MSSSLAVGSIEIRGLNLLSKPAQQAARDTQNAFNKLGTSIKAHGTDIDKINAKSATLVQKSVALASASAQQIKQIGSNAIQFTEQAQQRVYKLQTSRLDVVRRLENFADLRATGGLTADQAAQEAILKRRLWNTNMDIGLTRKSIVERQALSAATQTNIQAVTAEKVAINQSAIANNNMAVATHNAERALEMKAQALAATKLKVDNLRASLTGLAQNMSSIGLMMTAGLTMPIVAAGTMIAKVAVDFDKSMRNIQSIGKQTDDQMKTLGDGFRNMSTDLRQTVASPKELAEAFYEIQSAAFYGADAQTILNASTKAATAGLADQRQTAQAVAMALHAYGAGANEATHYTDVMMRAVDIGIFRFEDLTTQMGDFIAAAGMMQIPIEQVMAALTTMTKKGLPIAEAATSLNRIMLAYLKPTKSEEELAKSLGITLSATTLKTLGLAGAMDQLVTATKGNEDVLVDLIGEARAIRGVFALASDGLQMFNGDVQSLYKSAGTVNQVFNTQTRAWDAQIKNLKNTMADLALQIGQQLVPALIEFANVNLRPLIANLRALPNEQIQSTLRSLLALAAAGPSLIGLSIAINILNTALGALVKLSGLLVVSIGSLVGALAFGASIYILARGLSELTMRVKEGVDYDLLLEDARNRLTIATQGTAQAQQGLTAALVSGNAKSIEAAKYALEEAKALEYAARMKVADTMAASAKQNMTVAIEKYNQALRTGNGDLEQAAIKAMDVARAQAALAEATYNTNKPQTDLQKQLATLVAVTPSTTDAINGIALATQGLTNKTDALSLALGTSIMGLSDYGTYWNAITGNTPTPTEASLKSYMDSAAETLADVIRRRTEATNALVAVETKTASDSATAWENAFQDAASRIKGYLTEGMNVSKGLGDLLNMPGVGGIGAGGNGPFEAIYRIQDIAMSKARGKGVDTDKWAAMYGLTPEAAAEIVKKFQMGLFDADVMKYVNEGQLVNLAQMQMAA
ncbi:MAG: phage tail tape measure protein, partial [Methylophilus sp.]